MKFEELKIAKTETLQMGESGKRAVDCCAHPVRELGGSWVPEQTGPAWAGRRLRAGRVHL